MDTRYGIISSAILHVLLLLLVIFGLPSLWKKPPEVAAISVEILPLADVSNVKPKAKPVAKQTEPLKEEKSKTVKAAASEATPPEPKPEPTPQPTPPPPTNKAEPKPEKKPEPPKKPAPKEQPKDKKKKKTEAELDSLLKTLEEPSAKSKEEDKKKKKKEEQQLNKELEDLNAEGEHNPEKPLSLSEKDMIRQQIQRCWTVPAGARDAEGLKITLSIRLGEDGTVSTVKVLSTTQSDNDYQRSAVESAVRAVYKCSPLRDLPSDKYDSWRELELTFDPKDML